MDLHTLHEVVSTASQLPRLIAQLIEHGETQMAFELLTAWDQKTMTYKQIHETATNTLKQEVVTT